MPLRTRPSLLALCVGISLSLAREPATAGPGGPVDDFPIARIRPMSRPPAPVVSAGPNVIAVSNCADSGDGSLRAAAATAVSGDTIDMTALACSPITISTGAVMLPDGEITLKGPADHALTIEQAPDSGDGGLLRQANGTRLALEDLVIANGVAVTRGGCIYSSGDIALANVRVEGCHVLDAGGGVFTYGNLDMDHSTIASCAAVGPLPNSPNALGGGAYAHGSLTMRSSTLSGNTASSGGGSFGGGAFVRGGAHLSYSTVSGNVSGTPYDYGNIGGISAIGGSATSLFNSTISGNTATWIGGFYSKASLSIANSTIAFNTGIGVTTTYAAGVLTAGAEIAIDSTILSNNVAGGRPFDLAGEVDAIGDHDLIMASQISPPDTLTGDPLLGPLSDHGGPTQTHVPGAASIAIDAGSNPQSAEYDQRGPGHPRGIGAAPDIGATEHDTNDDAIFADEFE